MSNTVTTLDKKAIRKEILVLIVPIILEGIFGYLAGIVSSALVGRLSALAISSQGVVFRITDLLAVFWGGIRIGAMVYFVKLYGLGNTKVPMYISGFGIWIIRIPLASLAAWVFHWPLVTIWIIIAADQVIRYLLMHFYIKHINALYCVEEQEKKELEASKA